jgi:DHA2 family multidrug resistance protein
MIIFGTTQFIPQFLQEVMGYTATDAGFAMTAGGVATILAMPISGILATRLDPRLLVGFAFTVQGLALWNMAHLNTHIAFQDAALARMFQSVGLPFLFVPITNAAYVGLRPEESNQASALMNVARNLGGTIGIAFSQTLLAQRQQFHQSQLVENLNPLNPTYTAGVAAAARGLAANGMTMAQANQTATGQIYRQVLQQASMLSYLDTFHILMIAVFCALPLILIMQKPDLGRGGHGGGA